MQHHATGLLGSSNSSSIRSEERPEKRTRFSCFDALFSSPADNPASPQHTSSNDNSSGDGQLGAGADEPEDPVPAEKTKGPTLGSVVDPLLASLLAGHEEDFTRVVLQILNGKALTVPNTELVVPCLINTCPACTVS